MQVKKNKNKKTSQTLPIVNHKVQIILSEDLEVDDAHKVEHYWHADRNLLRILVINRPFPCSLVVTIQVFG